MCILNRHHSRAATKTSIRKETSTTTVTISFVPVNEEPLESPTMGDGMAWKRSMKGVVTESFDVLALYTTVEAECNVQLGMAVIPVMKE